MTISRLPRRGRRVGLWETNLYLDATYNIVCIITSIGPLLLCTCLLFANQFLHLLVFRTRCMVTILFPFLTVRCIATPFKSRSGMEICVTPVCNCSFDLVYNVTVTCRTNNVANDLRSFIKKPELTAAL